MDSLEYFSEISLVMYNKYIILNKFKNCLPEKRSISNSAHKVQYISEFDTLWFWKLKYT